METKKCKICGEIKSLDDFHNRKKSIDNKSPNCKKCATNHNKKEYYEKYKESKKAYYEKHKEIMNKKRLEKNICICGCEIAKCSLKRHLSSQKHAFMMSEKQRLAHLNNI